MDAKSELGLVNLSFPDTAQLLEDPCICIGEMRATAHMTPHAVGMVPNADNKLQRDSITVENGMEDITTMHDTIKGQMVNKSGISFGTAVLNDFAYSPQMK